MNPRTLHTLACSALLGATASSLAAASLVESFDTGLPADPGAAAAGEVLNLASGAWYATNHSDGVGTTTGVFEGSTSIFPAHEGTGFVGFHYQMTTGASTISAWLISPELSFAAGDVVSFYTRGPATSTYPDRLLVRFSDAGSSLDIGTTSADVGDFDVVLGTINPSLTLSGYPEAYTLFSFTVPTTASGRIAFQYHVTNSGPDGTNGNYIGVDTLTITSIPESSTFAALAGLAVLGLAACRRSRPTKAG